MKDNLFEELCKSINSLAAEIGRIRGEFDFLLGEIDRFSSINLAYWDKRLCEDPEGAKFIISTLGEDYLKECTKSAQDVLDEIPIDKEKLKASFNWSVDVLIGLHTQQIKNYSKLFIEIKKSQYEDVIGGSYEKGVLKENINNSLKKHKKIINSYEKIRTELLASLEKIASHTY